MIARRSDSIYIKVKIKYFEHALKSKIMYIVSACSCCMYVWVGNYVAY